MSPPVPMAIMADLPAQHARAALLAARLGLPLVETVPEVGLVVRVAEDGLTLHTLGPGAPGPVRFSFTDGAVDHRRRFGGGIGQHIAKAVGCREGRRPHVADVTAGMGRDGFVLATLGCTVTLVERHPVVHALLEDALERAADHPDTAEIAARMQLVHAEATAWLADHTADVIALDPMFPHRGKSSLVKKEMRVFRGLVGDDADADALLEAAWAANPARVVVKRPRHAPPLGARAPSHSIEGKSGRFDVYVARALPKPTET